MNKKLIKDLIKRYWDNQISNDVINYVFKQSESYADNLIKSIVDAQNEYNQIRRKAHLPEKKTLTANTYLRL